MCEPQCWPEQEAVEAWLKKHEIKVTHNVSMELKEAVTVFRIKSDDRVRELEKLLEENKKIYKDIEDAVSALRKTIAERNML